MPLTADTFMNTQLMKGKILIVLLVLIPAASFAQKMPEDWLEEGNDYYHEKKYDDALRCYKFIVDNHPRNEIFPMACYNIGKVYAAKKNYDSAIITYSRILESSFNDSLLVGGSSIMSNPYANFSFYSCIDIAELCYKMREYEKSLGYFTMADTSKLLVSYCGNEIAEYNNYLSFNRAKCYLKLDEQNAAIKILTGKILDDGMASNKEIIELLIQTLDKNYSRNEVKKILSKSINNIYTRNDKFYIKLFSVELLLNDNYRFAFMDKISVDDCKKFLMKNKLFEHYLSDK